MIVTKMARSSIESLGEFSVSPLFSFLIRGGCVWVWCVYFTMALHNLKISKCKAEVKGIYWHWPKYIQILLKNKLKTFLGFSQKTPITLKARCANVPLWKSTCRQQVSPRGQLLSLNNCRAEVLRVSGCPWCFRSWWRQGQVMEARSLLKPRFSNKISLLKFYVTLTSGALPLGCAERGCWAVTWKPTGIRT